MSKEYLEAFGRITSQVEYDNDSSYDYLCFEDDCKAVDEALERLESIENAEPSEALNVLKATEKYTGIDLTAVKNALIKAQKEHQALEALKENFEFDLFEVDKYKVCIYSDDDYYDCVMKTISSEEDFNVLKEVL